MRRFALLFLMTLPFVALAQSSDPYEFGLNTVHWVQSPNFNHRPSDAVVDTVVIHHTAGPTTLSCVDTFLDTKSQVSAHYVIGRDGSIIQMVSSFERAWQAGVSTDAFGRKNVNNFSIGIELVNVGDGRQPYPEAQLEALDHLLSVLMRRFPIKQFTSHEFIAEPQGRKNDPKAFPWDRLKKFGVELHYGLKPKPPV